MNDDLFEKYLGNRLSAEEAVRLKQVLSGDRDARAQFVQFLQEWQMFAEAARQVTAGLTATDADVRAADEAAVHGDPLPSSNEISRRRRAMVRVAPAPRRQPAGRRLAAVLLPVSALAACLVVAVLMASPTPKAEAVATVVVANPGVLVMRGDQRAAALAGAALMPGDALSVPMGAKATVRYADDTRLDIAPGTTVVLVQAAAAAGSPVGAAGKRVTINWGSVTAEVAKQPPGHPMIFATPNAQATVIGTRLTLEVNAASTRLEVEHGLVGIARHGDHAMVDVAAGQFATVAENSDIIARPVAGEPVPVAEGEHRQGLKVEYFSGLHFFGTPIYMGFNPNVAFDLGLETAPLDPSPSHFSVRWSGQVQAPNTETYIFHVYADSGVRLMIDGKPIVDCTGDGSVKDHTGRLALEAGKHYALRLEYDQPKTGVMIRLSWESPSQHLQLIPPECLSTEP